jgi:hypothetical protein
MKNILLFILFLSFTACTVNKEPEFKAIENVKVINYSISTITIASDLVFFNPNSIGGKLELTDLKIYSNDLLLAETKSQVFKAPAKKDFTIPLTTQIRTNNLIKNRKDLMALAMNASLELKIPLHYKGNIVYKLGKLSYTYPIDFETEVSLEKS